jgi:hypothetical protein
MYKGAAPEGGDVTELVRPGSMKQEWQQNLLPLMRRTLVGLTVFFFVASCLQLVYLNESVLKTPKADAHDALALLSVKPQSTSEDILAATRLRSIVVLETAALNSQYHQAGVLLMSRLWTTYLGFVTGMILSLVGAAFVLGQLKEETSELKTQVGSTMNLSFSSASPGLILAVLGASLMIAAIVTHHSIDVTQRAIYLLDSQSRAPESSGAPPPLVIPDDPKTH